MFKKAKEITVGELVHERGQSFTVKEVRRKFAGKGGWIAFVDTPRHLPRLVPWRQREVDRGAIGKAKLQVRREESETTGGDPKDVGSRGAPPPGGGASGHSTSVGSKNQKREIAGASNERLNALRKHAIL
jgi:hypothetical protein